jgi:hypothetical protein
MFLYNLCLFGLYVTVPLLIRATSASLLNLSMLTSDVYSVLFGIFLFHAHVRRGGSCRVPYRHVLTPAFFAPHTHRSRGYTSSASV